MTIQAPPVTVVLRGRSLRLFHLCGAGGLLAAGATAALLTHMLGLSPVVMTASAALGVASLILLTYATAAVLGREVIVNYHHLLAVTATTALVASMAAVPVVPHLAAFVVSLMVFQACGRLGCLSAGCCHGRPAGWGVRYGDSHAVMGFPAQLVGVPLLPVQALEAAWALVIAAGGVALLLGGAPARDVLLVVPAIYAVGRLGAEFLRGDPDRHRLGPLTQAQWTSLLLLVAMAGVGRATSAALTVWLAAVAAGATLGTLAWLIVRGRRPAAERKLLDPNHVVELAGALVIVSDAPPVGATPTAPAIHVATTSLGVSVSAGLASDATGTTRHYTVSHDSHELSGRAVRRLVRTIVRLRHPGGRGTVITGRRRGTFHVLIAMPGSPGDVRTARP